MSRKQSTKVSTILGSQGLREEEEYTQEFQDMIAVIQEDPVNNEHQEECVDPYVDITIGDKTLHLLVDSGARISMITYDLFKNTWPNRTLFPPDKTPVSYEGKKIDTVGYFEDTLGFKGREVEGKIYVARKGLNILGWLHQGQFKMILRPGTQEQVMVIKEQFDVEELSKNYPMVFSDNLGIIKGFKHKIKVKENAIPVKHKVRNVPYSLRADLEKELMSLQEKGIIEPIDSSLWLSPLVVARKPSGELRVCVDLRSLNKEIWVDSHPLPKIEDLLNKIGGSTWFSKIDLASAYHQVELEESSKHFTAFNSPIGTYQYCRMPFG